MPLCWCKGSWGAVQLGMGHSSNSHPPPFTSEPLSLVSAQLWCPPVHLHPQTEISAISRGENMGNTWQPSEVTLLPGCSQSIPWCSAINATDAGGARFQQAAPCLSWLCSFLIEIRLVPQGTRQNSTQGDETGGLKESLLWCGLLQYS